MAAFVTVAAAVGFATVAPSSSASAVTCRSFAAETSWYEAGRLATKTYTVPGASVSGCVDINVRNIKNEDPKYPDDNCAMFRVALFTNGENNDPTYSPDKFACSTGPNGAVRPIATNVPNGTKYYIIYNVETQRPNDQGFYRHNFTIVD